MCPQYYFQFSSLHIRLRREQFSACDLRSLGLIDTKVDTIEYCSEQIKELLPKLEAEQKTTLHEKQQRAAIVVFNSRSAAAFASQTLHAQVYDKWTVMEAPEPRQIIWSNLPRNYIEHNYEKDNAINHTLSDLPII